MNAHAVLVLGELKGAARAAVEQAHREASLEPTFVPNVDQGVAALDQKPWRAMLADLTTPGASRFCHEARGRRTLFNVPLIGLSPKLTDLAFSNALRWGADDLVALGAAEPLRTRLSATPYRVSPVAAASRGDAVIADPDQARCDVLGRVLSNAGFNVKYALDAVTTRFFTLKTAPELVVLNADVLEARPLFEEAKAAGKQARWIVMTRQRAVEQLAQELSHYPAVAVMGSHGPPENVLFYANILNPSAEARRRIEVRALHGTMVLFRSVGDERDECGFTYSVSAAGLYIRTLLPPPAKDVWLEVTPAGQSRRVRLAARVAWSRTFGQPGAETAPPGFGLRIVDGLGEDLALWEAGFQVLSPHAPESKRTVEPAPSFRFPLPSGRGATTRSISPRVTEVASEESPTSVPSLPARFSTRAPVSGAGASLAAAQSLVAGRGTFRPNSIAPMPVLSSPPPASALREPPPKAAERAHRIPNPTSNDDRGRTVLGIGIPENLRSLSTSAPEPGMQPADLAKLLADAGLLDTPEPAPVEPSSASDTNPPRDRNTISLSPGDLESLPPEAHSEGRNAAAPQLGGTQTESTEFDSEASVSEVLDRLFDPGAAGSAFRAEQHSGERDSATSQNPTVQSKDPSKPRASHLDGGDLESSTQLDGAAQSSGERTTPDAQTPTRAELAATLLHVPETAATAADAATQTPLPAAGANNHSSSVALSSTTPDAFPVAPNSRRKRVWAIAAAALAVAAVGLASPLFKHSQRGATRAALQDRETSPTAVSALEGKPTTEPAVPSAAVAGEPSPAAEPSLAVEPSLAANAAEPNASIAPALGSAIHLQPIASLEGLGVTSVTPEVVAEAPQANAGGDALSAPPDAHLLPEDTAYLYVKSQEQLASVFVHGVDYGGTNQWLRTKCGLRFVRLGTAPGKWLSQGLPTRLRCRAGNVVELNP